MSNRSILQFAPLSSAIDTAFWYKLTKKKLDEFKLDDKAVPICGFYSNGGAVGLVPIINIDYSAFDDDFQAPPRSIAMKGLLINTNTLEDFKLKDKKALLQCVGENVWNAIKDTAINDPSLLQFLLCLTFADLKKYNFYYWMAFPATASEATRVGEPKKICDYFDPLQLNQFYESYNSLSTSDKVAFLVVIEQKRCFATKLCDFGPLKERHCKILLGFADPSTFEQHPGWPLRNLLSLAAYHWSKEQKSWDVVCFRDFVKDRKHHYEHSIVISVELDSTLFSEECPDMVGWEKYKGQLIPRKVDMSANLDPTKLADAAVDLNLKLMRWRLSPDLQLQKIKSSRCLLFGAGTLGCNVARCLLGWGVRKITLIDNSNVSYSNPVRQTLFAFDDCLHGGKSKAVAAAEALKAIFPGVDASGETLSVPMPGHPISDKILNQVCSDIARIEELVSCHDIVFLLMDTRESRWLPTVLGAAKEKIVLNAALGFDTFLVMRHGDKGPERDAGACGESSTSKIINGSDLGCYFCNDIVAPGNSVQDRTLDQQCTVTRPGVSYMAAALAVELMVSILQHSKQGGAPASTLGHSDTSSSELSTELGIVPHQIRGHLDQFQNDVLTSRAFDRCTACSPKILEKYKSDGLDFLVKVFNEPNCLEDVTGLTELMTNINLEDICELSDDESI